MTSKFSIDNRELLQRISSGEAVVGIDFGNLIVRELAAFRLAAMDSSESVELPLDYLQGHKDGLEWAAQLAEANHHETGDWLYDDPIELAKAIRKGPDMPPSQPVADSEPVIVVGDDGGDALSYRRLIQSFEPGTKLYLHAQPAPVVPEDIPDSVYEILCQACGGNAWMYSDALWNACRAAMLEQQLVDRVDEKSLISINPAPDLVSLQKKAESIIGNYPGIPDCWCRTCRPVVLNDMRFVVCPDCGNKRCPRANDHRNACTGSNEHGQEGSAYPDTTQSPGSEPATVPGSWIPVSEQMPIEFEAVIAFDGDQVYGEAMYSSDDGFTIDGYEPCDRLNLQNVTYWMPLPAAPQEVKGE